MRFPILNPRKNFLSMPFQSKFDQIVNDFYNLFDQPRSYVPATFENLRIHPSLDIVEDEKNYKIEAEMPGMGEEDVKIFIDKNMLTIKGEKSTSQQDKDKNYLRREINYGYYERTIALPEYVDTENAKATFKKGMLWVIIPKNTELSGKQRELKVEKVGKIEKDSSKENQSNWV